jgi:hypothetical protein
LFQTPSYSLKPQNCRQNRQNWWGLMSLQTLSLVIMIVAQRLGKVG